MYYIKNLNTEQIIEGVLNGNIHIITRLIRNIDDNELDIEKILKKIHPYTGKAWIIGITGGPGVGKSTLIDLLVENLRSQGKTIGIIVIDPTSPLSGGAILGDRIRMQRHSTDEGVFIRSLATRNHFGGVTVSTRNIVKIMDVMGKDIIIIETVGAGQDEINITHIADTSIILVVPGAGDEIQTIKAGILEIGDIFVVNKSDQKGAMHTALNLKNMIKLRSKIDNYFDKWTPPIVMTCTYNNQGIETLLTSIKEHYQLLLANKAFLLKNRRLNRTRLEILELIEIKIKEYLHNKLYSSSNFLKKITHNTNILNKDPYTICEQIITNLFPF